MGGVPEFKDVEQEVEQNFYETRMMPAIRQYLTEMREEAAIDIKPGYVDTGASTKETKLSYSAYTPPVAKKKKKVERTRFRETAHSFRQKGSQGTDVAGATPSTAPASKKNVSATVQKPGKREKIRYGQAPSKTLPTAPQTNVEDAGGGAGASAATTVASATPEPVNPLDATKPTEKTRFSARAKEPRKPKSKGPQLDPDAPAPPDAAEIADRQEQASALGQNGDTSAKKKKKNTTTTAADKTRLADKNKKPDAPAPDATPAAPAPQTPAPPQ